MKHIDAIRKIINSSLPDGCTLSAIQQILWQTTEGPAIDIIVEEFCRPIPSPPADPPRKSWQQPIVEEPLPPAGPNIETLEEIRDRDDSYPD